MPDQPLFPNIPNSQPSFPTTPPDFPSQSGNETVTVEVAPSVPNLDNTIITVDGSPLTEYTCQVSYEEITGLYGSPVAGPIGTPADVVRLHAPMMLKHLDFTARRIGAKPLMPSTNTGNANDCLLRKVVSACFPGGMVSGEQVWTVTGRYTFLMRLPAASTDVLPIGSAPNDLTSPSQNVLTPSDFSDTLHGPAQPPNGAPATPINF